MQISRPGQIGNCNSNSHSRLAIVSPASRNFNASHWRGSQWAGADLSKTTWVAADIGDALFDRACLHGADFTQARAIAASFFAADLSDTCWHQAELEMAKFQAATLTSADFRGASLFAANLSGAYCERTNFAGANLEWANLENTVWSAADLTGARVRGALFGGATGLSAEQYRWLRENGAMGLPCKDC